MAYWYTTNVHRLTVHAYRKRFFSFFLFSFLFTTARVYHSEASSLKVKPNCASCVGGPCDEAAANLYERTVAALAGVMRPGPGVAQQVRNGAVQCMLAIVQSLRTW